MFNRQVEALLTITALSIFADKRVLSSEITAFIKSAKDIDGKIQSRIPITEAKLLIWFEMNRIRLSDKIRLGPAGFKHWFEMVLADLAEFTDIDFLMDLIKRISLADGELHISEKALFVLVEGKFKPRTVLMAPS